MATERPPARRILIVDDDPSFLMAMARYFEERGYLVDLAPNAVAAIILARCRSFSAAIVDVYLVGSSGFELVPQLRAEHNLRSPKELAIILVSGEDPATLEQLAISCGADAYAPKPLLPEDVHHTIEKLLGA